MSSTTSSSSLKKRSNALGTPSSASPSPTPIPKSHNNRGHPLFRATQSSTEGAGYLLRMLRYTQGWTTIVTAVGVLWTARAESVFFVAGALVTSTIAKILKMIIRDPRPDKSAVTRTFGLPSTHSSTVTFLCSYVVLGVAHRVALSEKGGLSALTPLEMASTLFLVVFPPLVMWSRVALGVHTTRQVVAGGLLGLTCAVGWWALWRGTVPVEGRVVGEGLRRHWLAVEGDKLIAKYKRMVISVLLRK